MSVEPDEWLSCGIDNGMKNGTKMEDLTSQERLDRICKILIKGVYLYANKQSWLEYEATNKDPAKDMIMAHHNKKTEIACFSSCFEGQK